MIFFETEVDLRWHFLFGLKDKKKEKKEKKNTTLFFSQLSFFRAACTYIGQWAGSCWACQFRPIFNGLFGAKLAQSLIAQLDQVASLSNDSIHSTITY